MYVLPQFKNSNLKKQILLKQKRNNKFEYGLSYCFEGIFKKLGG